jgi:hypothetical protein
LRLSHDRTRDRDALLLAARELTGAVIEPFGETHALEHFARPLAGSRPRRAGQQKRHHDVLFGVEVAEQVVELEYEADRSVAHARELGSREREEVVAVEPHLPAVRRVERAKQVEQRALADARLSDYGHALALAHFQVQPAQDVDRALPVVVVALEADRLERRGVTHTAARRPARRARLPCREQRRREADHDRSDRDRHEVPRQDPHGQRRHVEDALRQIDELVTIEAHARQVSEQCA